MRSVTGIGNYWYIIRSVGAMFVELRTFCVRLFQFCPFVLLHFLKTSASFGSENDYKFSQQVVAESSTDKEAAFYSSVSSNPILPQIPFEQQTSEHSNSFLITPKPEPMPYVDISELMNTYGNGGTHQLVSLAQQGNLIPVNISKPPPVTELFGRLEKKNEEVVALCPVENQGMILEILRKVQQGLFAGHINKSLGEICVNCIVMFLVTNYSQKQCLISLYKS